MAVGPEFPVRVTAGGGIYVQKDREVPDTFFMNVDYSDWTMQLACSVTSGKGAPLVFHGSQGTIMVAEDSEAFQNTEMVVIPDRDYKDDFVKKTGAEELRIAVQPFVRGEHPHMDNFLEVDAHAAEAEPRCRPRLPRHGRHRRWRHGLPQGQGRRLRHQVREAHLVWLGPPPGGASSLTMLRGMAVPRGRLLSK